MQDTAFKYKLEVQEGGKVELSVPLPKGTRVAVFVMEESEDDFSDLVLAAQSSLNFWNNPVDRVGAGDSFTGGFLFGYLHDGPAAAVRYGVAISALKQTNPGDLCWVSLEEVERLLEGGGLRIVR